MEVRILPPELVPSEADIATLLRSRRKSLQRFPLTCGCDSAALAEKYGAAADHAAEITLAESRSFMNSHASDFSPLSVNRSKLIK